MRRSRTAISVRISAVAALSAANGGGVHAIRSPPHRKGGERPFQEKRRIATYHPDMLRGPKSAATVAPARSSLDIICRLASCVPI
jgi:hypothetical protein